MMVVDSSKSLNMAAKRPAASIAPEWVTKQFTRWTRPRDVVFDAIARTRQPVSATHLFDLIRPSRRDIGLTTVYRTLHVFAKAGLVRRVGTQSGEVRFEYKRGDRADHHGHLICTACNRIVNCRQFEKDELHAVRRSEALLAQRSGFLIRDHNVDFIGLCPECRRRGAGSSGRHAAQDSAVTPPPRARRALSRKEQS
jgi:Fur family transcriptional regulator, ferric uptake regulator